MKRVSKRFRWHTTLLPAVLLPLCLGGFAAPAARGAVDVYVTDYLAPQDKSVIPLGGVRTNAARLFATAGEYEPVSFAVRPDERVEQLFLAATDLSGPDGTIPKSNVRVRS